MIDGADVMVTLEDTASLQLIPPEKDRNSSRLSTDCPKSNCLFRAFSTQGKKVCIVTAVRCYLFWFVRVKIEDTARKKY